MMTKIEFGEWVKRERNSLGLSLRELSKKVETSHSHISNIENGVRPANLAFCVRFAKVLGIPSEEVERYAGIRPVNYIPMEPPTISPIAQEIANLIKNIPQSEQELVLRIARLAAANVNGMARASPAKQKAGTQP
jgi:transcriptional regulator with XRE-family HTH domain